MKLRRDGSSSACIRHTTLVGDEGGCVHEDPWAMFYVCLQSWRPHLCGVDGGVDVLHSDIADVQGRVQADGHVARWALHGPAVARALGLQHTT